MAYIILIKEILNKVCTGKREKSEDLESKFLSIALKPIYCKGNSKFICMRE